MQPEIVHRCESCGASIREPAIFCPECGNPLARPVADPADNKVATASEDPTNAAVEVASNESSHSSVTATEGAVIETPNVANAQIDHEPSTKPERHGARERTRETLHRASTAARGAIERPVKQVEKIHHVSTVMLEEAHCDPSLRFVLVALGLFILFVILLVLSKVMG